MLTTNALGAQPTSHGLTTQQRTGANAKPLRKQPFRFQDLPQKVKDRILGLVLVSQAPICIDFTWLRSFVNGHSRVPAAENMVKHEGVTYRIPASWNEVRLKMGRRQTDIPTTSAGNLQLYCPLEQCINAVLRA
jgi:hypothetical protein